MNDLMLRLKECMVEHLRLIKSAEQIGDNDELTGLGMDSMAATNLMIDIEDEFDVQFTDDQLTPETFKSPATLLAAVVFLQNSRATA